MASARAGSSTAAASSFFATFSFSGTAGNIAAAARRVALRRLTRARQSMRATTAARNASAPITPPTIAGILFLEDELWDGSCVEDSPGTDVWVVVGVAGAARVPGWPALTSVASVWSGCEHSVLIGVNGVKLRGDERRGPGKNDTQRTTDLVSQDWIPCSFLLSSKVHLSAGHPHAGRDERGLTVTSRNAHSCTFVPEGMILENLECHHHQSCCEYNNLGTNVVGGSVLVQFRDHVSHLYITSKA